MAGFDTASRPFGRGGGGGCPEHREGEQRRGEFSITHGNLLWLKRALFQLARRQTRRQAGSAKPAAKGWESLANRVLAKITREGLYK